MFCVLWELCYRVSLGYWKIYHSISIAWTVVTLWSSYWRGVLFSVREYLNFLNIKLWGRIDVTGRRTRGRKQLLHGLKGKRLYCKLKGEVLDRSLWKTRFGRGCGPVVRQTQYERILMNLVLQKTDFARCVKFTWTMIYSSAVSLYHVHWQQRMFAFCHRL
jgi:hypothetical protein